MDGLFGVIDHRADSERGIRATVAVPLHNHADFIEERLESLFTQWLPGLELLLVDDASTDDGFAIAERTLARNPHIRATTIRNETSLRVGVLGVVLSLARGDIIIQADSDDVALPGRLQATLACFSSDPTCRLVTSNAVLLSADGFPARLWDTDYPDEVFTDPRIAAAKDGDTRWLGTTMAFHRSIFDDLPPIDPATCPYGLDLLLPFRALLLGSHHYVSRPLVGWRQHGLNNHKFMGSASTSLRDVELYQAMEMMILGQKLKDAKHVRSHPVAKPTPGDLVDCCHMQFFAKYDKWCRLRTSIFFDPPEPRTQSLQRSFPIRPPVMTLDAGERIAFDTKFGAASLEGWTGFNDVEHWGVWTKRHALICFRIIAPDVTALRLSLGGLNFLARQRVSLSIGLETWQEIELDGPEQRIVDVPIEQPGMAWLFIHAHDATMPPSTDARLLGVGLRWIEAVAAPRHFSVGDCMSSEQPAEVATC